MTEKAALPSLQVGVSGINRVWEAGGALATDPDAVCEVFAHFYEHLYKEEEQQGHIEENRPDMETTVTAEEATAALKRLKNMKTGSDDGLVAEMLKTGHTGLISVLARFFSEILT